MSTSDDPAPHLRPRGEFAMRHAARLSGRLRLDLQVQRDTLLHELRALDTDLERLATRRFEILETLGATRDRLWPRAEWCHGRRPPATTNRLRHRRRPTRRC